MTRSVLAMTVCLTLALAWPGAGDVTGVVMTRDGAAIEGAEVGWTRVESTAETLARLASDAPHLSVEGVTRTDKRGSFTLKVPNDITVIELRVSSDGYIPAQARVENGREAPAVALREWKERTIRLGGSSGRSVPVVTWGEFGELITSTDENGVLTLPDVRPIRIGLSIGDAIWEVMIRDQNVVTLPSVVPVEARVFEADGETPVAGAEVWMGAQMIGRTDDQGRISQQLPSDWSELIVRSDDEIAILQAGRAATTSLRKGASLSGRIVSAADGRAVAGAEMLWTEGGERFSVLSDSEGRISSAVLPPERSRSIVIRHPEFVELRTELAADRGGPITLTPAGRVTGRVVDDEAKGIAGARVAGAPDRQGPFAMRRPGSAGARAWSDPTGKFILTGVEPGSKIGLSASKRGLPESLPAAVEVRAGETTADTRITIPIGIALTGVVETEDGVPVANASIETTRAQMRPRGRMIRRMMGGAEEEDPALTDREGRFEVRVREGSYDVSVKADGFAPRTIPGVEATAGREPLRVVLRRGHALRGRVLSSDGQGVEGVRVDTMGGVEGDAAITGPDGAFVISDLAAGEAMVIAVDPERAIREMRTVRIPGDELIIELPPTGTITGVVRDASSGDPIRSFTAEPSPDDVGGGAMAVMIRGQTESIESDDGSFRLEDVPEGRTQIRVAAAGYLPETVRGIEVAGGEVTETIEIELKKGVRVVGRVTGPDGDPVAGARVSAASDARNRPFARPGSGEETSTDAGGSFVLEAVPPGEQTITVSHSDYQDATRTVELEGDEETLDVRLERGLRLTGTVLSAAGVPVRGAEVRARSGSNRFGFGDSVMTDESGRFELKGLSAGRYTVVAAKQGNAPGELENLDLASDRDVQIRLEEGGIITGRVIGLEPSELDRAVVAAGQVDTPVRPDGTFRLEGVSPGPTTVVGAAGSMMSRRQSRPVSVDVSPGTEQSVEIVFSDGIVISGRILKENEPVNSGMILFRRPGATTSAGVQADGRYEVTVSEPGRYEVSVLNLENFGTYSTEYEVRRDDTFDIVIRGATVAGEVRRVSGGGVGDASVRLEPVSREGGFPQIVTTSPEGSYRFEDVVPGEYTISARSDSEGTASRQVLVTASGADVDLILSGAERLVLRIVDPTGRPVEVAASLEDANGATVWRGTPAIREDGTARIEVGAGTYTLRLRAEGYARAERSVIVPGPEQRIVMSGGGSLEIVSSRPGRVTLQLLDPSGRVVPLGWTDERTMTAGRTRIDDLAAGRYTLRVTDQDGNVSTVAVEIRTGESTTVNL